MKIKKYSFILALLVLAAYCMPARAQTPGGVSNPGYTWAAWLTPDSYDAAGTWTNLITSLGTVGDFTAPQTAPEKITGYNFQEGVYFRIGVSANTAPNRLISTNNYAIANNDNVTVFLVMDRIKSLGMSKPLEYVLSFNNSTTGNQQLLFANTTTDLRLYWPTTPRYNIFDKGIFTFDNSNNSATDGIAFYNNGAKSTQASGVANNGTSNKLIIGSARNVSSFYGYVGGIAEVIVLKGAGTNNHVEALDIQKIHSYLAIKYGMTLNNADNYINSDGTVIWDRTANEGYNNNIFGLARDDASGSYQKQAISSTSSELTAFVGIPAPLNKNNIGGTLSDKQSLLIGSNGKTLVVPLTGISDGDVYENGSISAPQGLNIQTAAVYKTQLTGSSLPVVGLAVTVPGGFTFTHALVSKDADFTPASTRVYPVLSLFGYLVAMATIDNDHKFIKFVGLNPGPGGIGTGLKLWLRADDEASLTILNLAKSNAGLLSYPEITTGTTLPAVSEWKDLERGHNYSFAAGGTATAHRYPVLKSYSPELNYHPAVRFWANPTGSGVDYTAYLGNASGIMPAGLPAAHSAFFMVNNDFGRNRWFYTLMFGNSTLDGYRGPGYGAQQIENATKVAGRFRTSATQAAGTKDLFDVGTTTILDYLQTGNTIKFRFNGQEDSRPFSTGNFNMSAASTLGSGYRYDRTMDGVMSEAIIFDRALSQEELTKLESYMALKYGITLRPQNTTSQRFSYKFSDGSLIWDGEAASGEFVDFYNNISAVVRDDAAKLNNTHSHSTNIGSLLHLGVAGTRLSADGSGVGALQNNLEAVAFGNDGGTGSTHLLDEDCGFTDRFNRKWLVHKVTAGNRPIGILVGAQNNGALTIGADPAVYDYYNKLTAGQNVTLLVGDSPADLEAGIYTAVVPMSFVNGEHQCNYNFTDEDTYITFGWKDNGRGCPGDEDAQFVGTKTFNWTQWTAAINNSTKTGPQTFTVNNPVDLGDNIHVTQSQVLYPSAVRIDKGYPRSFNGSLQVRRSGSAHTDIEITATFDHPIVPEFSILDIDGYSGSYEEVAITGECAGNTYLPVLSYASTQTAASYNIVGNTATAYKNGNLNGSNRNGTLNVTFQGGVTKVKILYRLEGSSASRTRMIFVSPISIRPVPPPPPFNEHGLSFTKQVKERDITTCDPVEYTFYIGNANCDPKVVNFKDTLPVGLKWEAASLGLDAISSLLNPSLSTNVYGGSDKLIIDNLVVPGARELILKLTAVIDDDVLNEDDPDGYFCNHASITYEQIINGIPELQPPYLSLDRETLDPETCFGATWQQPLDTVKVVEKYSPSWYYADSQIEVTYTVDNTNANITDMYLDVEFNDEFNFVAGSFTATQLTGTATAPLPVLVPPVAGDGTLTVAADVDGLTGFTLPTGKLEFKFKLRAPNQAGIVDELDGNGVPTGEKVDLEIAYDFTSTADDSCVQAAIKGMNGNKRIPYLKIAPVITNKHTTTRIIK